MKEIYPPKIQEFSSATANGYSVPQIVDMEKKILNVLIIKRIFKIELFLFNKKVLLYKINPPTINFWLNWYLSQWDIFID